MIADEQSTPGIWLLLVHCTCKKKGRWIINTTSLSVFQLSGISQGSLQPASRSGRNFRSLFPGAHAAKLLRLSSFFLLSLQLERKSLLRNFICFTDEISLGLCVLFKLGLLSP